jgi:nucleotide-binding universal stress UspA family protein
MILPIRKILWPTDFSESSRATLAPAAELAEHFGATLVMLHVTNPNALGSSTADVATPNVGYRVVDRHAEAHQVAGGTLNELEQQEGLADRGLRIERLVDEGDPGDLILRAAEQHGIDLIVLSNDDKSTWRRLTSGSVPDKVARGAPCPVLMLPG